MASFQEEGSGVRTVFSGFPLRNKSVSDVKQEKRPASSILSVTDIKEDGQDRDELQLLGFDLHKCK